MSINKKFSAGIFFLFCLTLSSQEKSKETELITETIENYFYGYLYGDSEKLNQAFDTENGAMKVISTADNGNETVNNIYFKDLITRWTSRDKFSRDVLENSSLEILEIDDVDGKIASARIRMKVGETVYIDILSLHKINQQWKITNKIFLVAE